MSFTLLSVVDLAWQALPGYAVAQIAGAIAGVWATHAMFGLPIFDVAIKLRPGGHLIWSEFVATIGLLGTVLLCSRFRNESTPHAGGCCDITAAYWFTASTSFANPAVTLGRSITNTFTGIAPMYVVGFIAAQSAAALVASWFVRGTVFSNSKMSLKEGSKALAA